MLIVYIFNSLLSVFKFWNTWKQRQLLYIEKFWNTLKTKTVALYRDYIFGPLHEITERLWVMVIVIKCKREYNRTSINWIRKLQGKEVNPDRTSLQDDAAVFQLVENSSNRSSNYGSFTVYWKGEEKHYKFIVFGVFMQLHFIVLWWCH